MNQRVLVDPAAFQPGRPPDMAAGILTVDLDALARNYLTLARRVGRAECAGVVKGNAYGLGISPIARTLWQAGCRTFFVARPSEGKTLRHVLPQATIYVLDGLYPGHSDFYLRYDLRPVLTSIADAQEWADLSEQQGRKAACGLHVDTGINRLGFSREEFDTLATDRALLGALEITHLMSHLACADDASNPMNERQLQMFTDVRRRLPNVKASLSNSSGIFLGARFHQDVVRPGIALYGGSPICFGKNPMQVVVSIHAKILQIRTVQKGEAVGYGATWTAPRNSLVAVVGAGYRDGIPRNLGHRQNQPAANFWLNGYYCPIVGRISMDLLAVDVTDIETKHAQRGGMVEIFGSHLPMERLAADAETISYELFTRIGERYERRYLVAGAVSTELI